MTLTQRVTQGFPVLSSVLCLGIFVSPIAAETINNAADVAHNTPINIDIASRHTAGNCHQIERDTIILSGSTAIFAQPQTNVRFSPDTAPRPVLLTLAAPLLLTDNCVLGTDTSTLIEAQLETTDSVEGLIIKTQSIVVSGHYLPLLAESNIIPFEKHVKQHSIQQTNSPLCAAIGILPNVFIDSHEMGVGISSQELSSMTGSFCELFFSQSSHFLQAELKSDTFYSLRLPGAQSIPVPSALRTFVATE
ncbi:MAG: hypothetical protein AAF572_15520 [Cyanobacteria bacterium P01_B01_bin.77]